MIAGGYLWLTLSDGTVTAWDTRYGVLSFSSPSMSPLTINTTNNSTTKTGNSNDRNSREGNNTTTTTTLVQVSAVVVSDNGLHKDTTAVSTTSNNKQYHYYLTIASSVEGTTSATSVTHGPISVPSGYPLPFASLLLLLFTINLPYTSHTY